MTTDNITPEAVRITAAFATLIDAFRQKIEASRPELLEIFTDKAVERGMRAPDIEFGQAFLGDALNLTVATLEDLKDAVTLRPREAPPE
jgi:hypothetical protein